MLEAVKTLNMLSVDLIAIGCNTAHHWYGQLAAISHAPIIHIADAAVAALGPVESQGPVAVLATRGVLASGFYQSKLAERGFAPYIPDESLQCLVDTIIAAVKGSDLETAAQAADALTFCLKQHAIRTTLLACTELPIAWSKCAATAPEPLHVIDINQAFARGIVDHLTSRFVHLPCSGPTASASLPPKKQAALTC